jgi:membrane protein required for colicin V production
MGFEFSDLNGFDFFVISVVLLSSLLAFFRGFIKAFLSLITWLASILITGYIYLEHLMNMPSENKSFIIIGTVVIFLVVFVVFFILNSKAIYALRKYRKGAIDQSLGFAFGFLRGVVIVSLFFYIISLFSNLFNYGGDTKKKGPAFFIEAKTYNLLEISNNMLLSFLPDDLPEMIVKKIDGLRDEVSVEDLADITSGNGLPRALTNEEKIIMSDIISALPDGDYAKIREKYDDKVTGLSDLDEMEIFRIILSEYDKAQKAGKIADSKKINETNIKRLDEALNGIKQEENNIPSDAETGYKKMNIKQLDRLIETIQ